MRFTVKFTTSAGEILIRDFEGANPDDVRARVLAEGNFPMEVRRSLGAFRRQKELGADTLILFNQELLALLKAGIPLLQSLELLVGHGKDPLLRRSLERVVELLREGMSFSEAMEQVGTFPAVYRANVVAGERSGTLPDVIARWLAFQAFAQTSRRRIVEALFYPAFLIVVLIIALGVIFNIVLPRFAEIYNGSGIEMPRITQALLDTGNFVRRTWYFQVAGLVGAVVALRWMLTTESGKRQWERMILALPRLGVLYRMYHSSVFTRTLGVLLSGGMPVLQALEVIQRTTPSERMRTRLHNVVDLVRAGTSLHLSLEQSKLLDPLAVEMTRVGEQSSALPDMLNHVSDFFDQEVEKATTAVTSLIGPVLILFMGVTVLGLLLAVYIPLFTAGSTVR
ncbi:type II secretion system F family protein [Mesoterricola sediminis]|uniref:Type II secretion system protein F n=1 Tax=Mesoterricola sediminis TaxID=2927980 RepID=A0AA48GS78_9BACT|nr:type II secretion system F family protein [Mesoterricola sediminis]BDU75209.1 type II secretion system protein F [Mesoterricola sediminis]